MPFVKVRDLHMYYEIHGKGEPLVLIAGFTYNCMIWQEVLPFLTKHFQLLIFDNRGSGQTEHLSDRPCSIEAMAKDTVGLMETLHWKKANIVGHSMGTAIAQQICLDFPQVVRRGVLCSPFAKLPEKSINYCDVGSDLIKAGVDKELIIKTALPWICSNALLGEKGKFQEMLYKRLNDPFPQILPARLCQAEALRSFDIRDKLGKINTPLLIVVGDEDILTPPSCAELLAEKIPHAELFTFKGQAHSLILEKPQELSELMISYLYRS